MRVMARDLTQTSPAQDEHIEGLFISAFGASSEQFKRELEAEFEKATPEEQAKFERLIDEANAVLPGMHASVDRMRENLAQIYAAVSEMGESMAALNARVSDIEGHLNGLSPERVGRG